MRTSPLPVHNLYMIKPFGDTSQLEFCGLRLIYKGIGGSLTQDVWQAVPRMRGHARMPMNLESRSQVLSQCTFTLTTAQSTMH